ncbi:MAG: hypothetical protein IJ928_09560 [Prevotella sp.]|nr:hypothetical protein [Prevotella sp.]
MSQKRKNQRARYEAKQAKNAEKVIYWIIGVLIVLALFMVIYLSLSYA